MGFYGNQARGYSSAEVAVAKSTTESLSTAGKVLSKGGAALGVLVAGLDVYQSGFSNRGIAKGVVGLTITGVVLGAALVAGSALAPALPFVGLFFASANLAGGYNAFYDSFSNTPAFGNAGSR
jgi:hypothetical protein